MTDTDWSSANAAAPDLMAALQDRLSVALIATPRRELRTCRSDETLAAVVARNADDFDYFPVTDGSPQAYGRIVGLIKLLPYFGKNKEPKGTVREDMLVLSEDYLIGANAGILEFVRNADRNGCRLVVSGAIIKGLVTLSDLQKLPVRSALFALSVDLEVTMADAIRREFDRSDRWKERLSKEKRTQIENKRNNTIADNIQVDDLLFTDFSDKRNIILNSPLFPNTWRKFDGDSIEARNLRNNLVHANEYAATHDAAAKVCDTVRKIEHWIAHLSEWPSKQVQSGE